MKRLILGAAALAMSASFALAGTVRMGTEGAYPPYNFVNDNGQVDGFERALGDALCKREKLTCTWTTNKWDSIIPNLVSGNYDTIMAGMSITPARSKVIDFTQAYLPPTPSAYMALKQGVNVKTGVIAAQTGTIQANFVAKSGATLVEFATADETVAAVKNGQADAVLADKSYLAPIVKESKGKFVFTGGDQSIGGGIGMGLRKSDTALKAKFNDAITAMKKDGSLRALTKKWFGDKVPSF